MESAPETDWYRLTAAEVLARLGSAATGLDDEVTALLEERESRVRRLIEERREALGRAARRLLEVEVLHAEEFERLAGCGASPGAPG